MIARVIFGIAAQPFAVLELFGILPERKLFDELGGFFLLSATGDERTEINLEVLFELLPPMTAPSILSPYLPI